MAWLSYFLSWGAKVVRMALNRLRSSLYVAGWLAVLLAGWGPLFARAQGPAQSPPVHVAVAANMAAPMQKIAQAFTQDTGYAVLSTLGSTGKLYAQIRNGAPYHLLLAADSVTPQRLEAEQQAVAGTRWTYAHGRLLLWSAQPGLVDAAGRVLAGRGFAHLAMADPKLAPYGAAALQTLTALGLWPQLQPRVVQAESIAQVHQFVHSGAAELGFVALSQVMENGQLRGPGSAWLVPTSLHAPLAQDGVLLLPGKDLPAAAALLRYLRTDKVRAILRGYGYEP